jgi:hypothetical protein
MEQDNKSLRASREVRASPPAPPIAAPIAIWGPGSKMGSHQRVPNGAGQFWSQIESPATPCQSLRQWRESDAPVPRGTTVFAGGGALSARGRVGSHGDWLSALMVSRTETKTARAATVHAASTYLTHTLSMRVRRLP